MGIFERYLSAWIGLAMIIGVGLGVVVPSVFAAIAGLEIAHVNLVIAVLIWLMVYPMMIQIDFESIKNVGKQPKGLLLTLTINWLIKPFSMAALAWVFFKVFFAGLVDAQTANEYIAGMILLGVAPCTAMVFVWSHLTRGDANYTLVQVSINDLIMVVAFAPITALLLGGVAISVPWQTLILSVVLYIVLPLMAGFLTRKFFLTTADSQSLNKFVERLKPLSMMGLVVTVLILFALQANTILTNPFVIGLIAIPLLLQTYGIFALGYSVAKWMKLPFNIAAPACMIGTSNFFELAVAVAISLFGLHSGAALATVVGVLVEVPVMLSLVSFANRTQHWFGKAHE